MYNSNAHQNRKPYRYESMTSYIHRYWSTVIPKNVKSISLLGRTLGIWFALRLVSSLFSGFVSYLRPLTDIEQRIHLLPPTPPLMDWAYRVFLSPWYRWDAVWYTRIVMDGYTATDGTSQFHPLYPWLAVPLAKIGISPILSLLLITSLAGIVLFFVFFKLSNLDTDQKVALFTLLLFALTPASFILYAPYAEALFLLLAVLCFYCTRKKMWWLACFSGGLAVLTRQQGLLLLLPVAWELWEDSNRNFSTALKNWRKWLSLGLFPISLMVWISYRAFFIGDFHPDFASIQTFIYSVLISPSARQVVTVQQFIWPWQLLTISIQKLFTSPDIDLWVNIILGILFLIGLSIAWRNMRLSYKIYSILITFVAFSYYTGPIHPLMGLPRHLLLAFPVFIALAPVFNSPWKRVLIIALSTVGWFLLLLLFGLNTWVA